MIINNEKHIRLIQDELTYQTNEFEKLLRKQAAKMFVDNQLYLCRYQGFDEARGNLIVKFDHKICSAPRKNERLQCFVSSIQDDSVKNWGGLTYQDLRTNVATQFESNTVFFTYEKDYTIVGLSGVKIEDIQKYEKNALVFLAPTDPPLHYLENLANFLKETNPITNNILNLNIENPKWNPQPLIVDGNISEKFKSDFNDSDIIIIQGPPGTGKTYLMAQLCSELLNTNHRILVTALTNRALIELAEKEHLKTALAEGKIYKSALTADEFKNKKIKGIQSFKSLSQQQPPMLLSTYYIMSQIASKAVEDNHFDYIIVEEASQAFLSTIALVRKLGKKCIVIGDIKQLEPIFHKDFAPEDVNNCHWMVCGLKAISFYLTSAQQYILTDSYRLTPNSVIATNSFYSGLLKSKSQAKLPLDFSKFPLLEQSFQANGGTTLQKFKLPDGRIPSTECSNFIVNILLQLKQYDKNTDIAVLAFNRDTIRFLQKEIYSKCANTDNIVIETIDRIQGLTTDFCIFFIPTESIPFALQLNRFNVATSRAKLATLIIADVSIIHFENIFEKIASYFKYIKIINNPHIDNEINNHLQEPEKVDNAQPETNTQNKIGIKIIGKIDISKFEKPKKEIQNDKENFYIIDTNVFVDYPEIISKIEKKYTVILSAKVLDELDKLKITLDNQGKLNVQKALKSINTNIDKRDIRMDTADLSLLPKDLNKKSPDNFILSVALKYKQENPILLTSDNGLQIKAKGFNITTITLKEFLKQSK
jgi:rRNA-processing protein FCF1